MLYEMSQKKKEGDKANNQGGGGVTKRLLRTMGMTEAEYKQLRPGGEYIQ